LTEARTCTSQGKKEDEAAKKMQFRLGQNLEFNYNDGERVGPPVVKKRCCGGPPGKGTKTALEAEAVALAPNGGLFLKNTAKGWGKHCSEKIIRKHQKRSRGEKVILWRE